MKLGVLTVVLSQMEMGKAMKYLADSGVQAVEIGTGGFPGNAHCKPEILLNDDRKLEEFKQAVYGNGLEISALSCHGNPVHPNKEIAKKFHDEFINTILLAEKLGIDRITAYKVGYCSRAYAHVCSCGAVNIAITNKRLASFGLISMLDYYTERCV